MLARTLIELKLVLATLIPGIGVAGFEFAQHFGLYIHKLGFKKNPSQGASSATSPQAAWLLLSACLFADTASPSSEATMA